MLLVFPLRLSAINFFLVGNVFVVEDVMQITPAADHVPHFFTLDVACSQDLLRKTPDTVNMGKVVTGIEFRHFLRISFLKGADIPLLRRLGLQSEAAGAIE